MKKRIYVAGHSGMVGSALVRKLSKNNSIEIITKDRQDLDLTSYLQVSNFLSHEKIDEVYVAAAKVGGIYANNEYPADFIYKNLLIQTNIVHSSYLAGIKKLLFLGSSCIYPRLAKQPIKESYLMTGSLEKTNEPYAVAKIAGIKMCESYNRQYNLDYRSVMPTNLYGPGDNFHNENSHVIPALLRRIHEAKINKLNKVQIWGSGNPKREFLYVDELAEACIFIMNIEKKEFNSKVSKTSSHVNVGTGIDCSIADLAEMIKKVVGYKGDLIYDKSKPDGTPRKMLDVGLINTLGWNSKVPLETGLKKTYSWYVENILSARFD